MEPETNLWQTEPETNLWTFAVYAIPTWDGVNPDEYALGSGVCVAGVETEARAKVWDIAMDAFPSEEWIIESIEISNIPRETIDMCAS
jgi:hypothetical protein